MKRRAFEMADTPQNSTNQEVHLSSITGTVAEPLLDADSLLAEGRLHIIIYIFSFSISFSKFVCDLKMSVFFIMLFSELDPEKVVEGTVPVTGTPTSTTKELTNMARERIQAKINSKEFKTKKRLCLSKGSSIWQFYEEIFNEKGHKIPNFIFCPQCETVKTYDTSCGSSNLLRHKEKCNSRQINTLDRFVLKNLRITKKDRDEVLNAAKRFCYVDLRPFYAIAGNGLLDLLMAVSCVTARHGLLSRDNMMDLIPHPTTVSPLFIY